jgi:hypothetical protein
LDFLKNCNLGMRFWLAILPVGKDAGGNSVNAGRIVDARARRSRVETAAVGVGILRDDCLKMSFWTGGSKWTATITI